MHYKVLIALVESMERWVCDHRYNFSEHYEQFGVVLDDSGLETMLEKLMDDYICPMSRGIV